MACLPQSIQLYQKAIQSGEIPSTYKFLTQYHMHLRAFFNKTLGDHFKFSNVAPGYMDYTYFYFFNESLRNRKLRFGLVLNHKAMCFEFWLLGQNANIQKHYWNLLKDSVWNNDRDEMPQYSIVETVLLKNPDFTNLDIITEQINSNMVPLIKDMMAVIEKLESDA